MIKSIIILLQARDDYKETVVVVMALLESLRVDTIKHVTFQLYVQGMPTSVLFKFLLNLNEMIYTCVVICILLRILIYLLPHSSYL